MIEMVKRIAYLAFLSVLLLLSIIPAPTFASSNKVATVYLNPATITATSVGQNFTVEVRIADVVDLYTFCCGLTWDPDALKCVDFKDGPFLTAGGMEGEDYLNISDPDWINNTAGEIYPPYALTLTWIGHEKGINGTGSGILYTAKFTAKRTGTFNVHPADLFLCDSEGAQIPTNVLDVFTIVQEENVYPIVIVSNLTSNNFYPPRIRIYDYGFNQTAKAISFEVTGEQGNAGFCNVTIPSDLLKDNPPEEWTVLIDDSEVPSIISHNATHTFIYFTYTLSTHKVVIKARVKTNTLSFSPASIIGPSIGETFKVNVTIQNVTHLFAYDITVSWDSEVLECIPPVKYLTDFFNSTLLIGQEVYPPPPPGKIEGIANSYISGSGATGSGPLVEIKFKVLDFGFTWINITVNALINSTGGNIPYSVVNGSFILSPGDCNGDGHVDGNDLYIMAGSWHKSVGNSAYDIRADFNMNGDVNGFDLYVMAVNWHRGTLD